MGQSLHVTLCYIRLHLSWLDRFSCWPKEVGHHVRSGPVRGPQGKELWGPQDDESRSLCTDSNKVGTSVLQQQKSESCHVSLE